MPVTDAVSRAMRTLVEVLDYNGINYRITGSNTYSADLAVRIQGKWHEIHLELRRNVPNQTLQRDSRLWIYPRLTAAQELKLKHTKANYLDLMRKKLSFAGEEYSGSGEQPASRSNRGKVVPGILRVVAQQGWLPQSVMAEELGVSQQSISKALRVLASEFSLSRESCQMRHLLDVYSRVDDTAPILAIGYTSLDHPLEDQDPIGAYLNELDVSWAYTGVVAADRYAPWKIPDQLDIICAESIDLEALNLYRTDHKPRIRLFVSPNTVAYRQNSSDETGNQYTDPLTTWMFLKQRNEVDDQQVVQHLEEWLLDGGTNLSPSPTFRR